MSDQSRPVCIFECSSNTYADCVQKELFGSNLPRPLQVKAGDLCFLYHYEVTLRTLHLYAKGVPHYRIDSDILGERRKS